MTEPTTGHRQVLGRDRWPHGYPTLRGFLWWKLKMKLDGNEVVQDLASKKLQTVKQIQKKELQTASPFE